MKNEKSTSVSSGDDTSQRVPIPPKNGTKDIVLFIT